MLGVCKLEPDDESRMRQKYFLSLPLLLFYIFIKKEKKKLLEKFTPYKINKHVNFNNLNFKIVNYG